MFVPDIIVGFRNYCRRRDLARRIRQEHEAREFFDEDWKQRHGL
jgi:hypothetical protein